MELWAITASSPAWSLKYNLPTFPSELSSEHVVVEIFNRVWVGDGVAVGDGVGYPPAERGEEGYGSTGVGTGEGCTLDCMSTRIPVSVFASIYASMQHARATQVHEYASCTGV